MSVAVIFFLNGHDSVVPYAILSLPCSPFDDPDQPTSQQTTGKRRLIHEHQNVDRVPILGDGRRYKSEVLGKAMPAGRTFFSSKILWSGSKAYLLRLRFGVFEDDLDDIGVFRVAR